ncbi:UDP-N-acetylmuramoyl-tripeptide--D-alanyl-D-alanine ligase [Arsenophonus symbiont of Ornithomya chloropus]|uniref:UDP-N-acetylmuramoyl-tripeptide--D-alanyl-D- alanine ligase n=1 Tax=Arsenophonus symbiont of Ornithomya chloropus TaxID=634121 RepID=UPI0032B20617
MISISLKTVAILTEGILYHIHDNEADKFLFNSVTIDSRTCSLNSLFIALKGIRYDGHDFANNVKRKGAVGLLVDRPLNVFCPQVIVKDTYLAMGKLAAWIRSKSMAKVIAITGSSGKTSVKEMVANILSQCGKTLFTFSNYNNFVGVALTLFQLTREYKYVVIEIGANHIGEIEYITNIVKPDSVLINNLFCSHIEGFGSLENIAKAKGEIFSGLKKNGTAIINLVSHDWKNWQYCFNEQQTVLFFSLIKKKEADFYAENISISSINTTFELHTSKGFVLVNLPLPGKHNISNALAASALAMSVGATLDNIKFGLSSVKSIFGRLYPIFLKPGKVILDDTYNANVGSMISAADVLSQMPEYRILVIGDMDELGDKSEIYHEKVGIAICNMKINIILSVGYKSIFISKKSCFGEHFNSKEKLIQRLIPLIKEHDIVSVLVKGSRNMRMEEIINSLKEYFLC